MHRFLAISLTVLMTLNAAWAADAPTLSVNRDTLYEGESIMLTVKVPDADEGSQPDLSGLPDARIAFQGSQADSHFQISFINGKMQREGFSGRTYVFEVAPLKTGTFPGGPVRVAVQGKTFTLEFPRLDVKEIPRQNQALLEVTADPLVTLADNPFTITLRLLVKRLEPPYAEVPPFLPADPPVLTASYLDGNPIEGLEMPDIRKGLQGWMVDQRAPGLRVNQYAESRNPFDMGGFFDGGDPFAQRAAKFLPPPSPVEKDGVAYFEYRLPFTFTAREEGVYTFGPATLKGNILTGVNERQQGLSLMSFAVGRAATVRVVPPPEAGRPDSFFGLTGSNLVADAELNANACRVGDPLKLTLKVRGPLNWRNAAQPNLAVISNLAARFQVYGSTLQTTKTEDGRNYSFTLRPLQPGTDEIPPIPFSWFDTQAQTYRTCYSAPIPLKVEPATELMAGPWIDAKPETGSESPAADLFAKTPAGLRAAHADPSASGHLLLLALAIAGPLLFLLRRLLDVTSRFITARQQGRRSRQALSRALRTLGRIRQDATIDPRNTASQASLMMRDFVADLLNREPGGLTPPDSARLLRERGVPDALAQDFETRMTLLFQASYSPESRSGTGADPLDRLPDLLQQIFRHASAAPRTGSRSSRALLLLILLGSGFGIPARGEEVSAAPLPFEWEEAQSLASTAATPAAFHEAARHFNALSEAGIRQGDLFYNLGTCLLMANEPQLAWRALVRAERYLGRPRDLVRNMNLARAALNGGEPAPTPWDRTLLYLHYGLPLELRLWIATGCFLLFWLVWAAAWGRVRGSVPLILAITLAGALIFGSSAAVTLFQESQEIPLSLTQEAAPHAAR